MSFAIAAHAFTAVAAPGTGRRCLRLTAGAADCYPLYYFIPTCTADGLLVYHRAAAGRIELRVLELGSGADRLLYQGSTPVTRWRPWDVEAGCGVWDHRSVLDRVGRRVIAFDGDQILAIALADGTVQELHRLPPGRIPIGQNCVTPDGRWLLYIHADAERFASLFVSGGRYTDYHSRRGMAVGTRLCALDLHDGQERDLVILNSPIHHVLPLPDGRPLFCHPTAENGMLLTDLQGGWYSHLRTQDVQGGCVCHYLSTARGIAYEVLGRDDGRVLAGLYDPDSHRRYEWPLPRAFGYTHTGHDPEGRLWFWENHHRDSDTHDLWVLLEHRAADDDDWLRLCHHWPTYGEGQRSHMHPQLLPDRRWLLFVSGDPDSGRNHLHVMDVADLTETRGIPVVSQRPIHHRSSLERM